MAKQKELFRDIETKPVFPATRYQGSKLKLVQWIWENIKHFKFESAIDAFGGTGAVGYLLKTQGKRVIYNDLLHFNYLIGLALIENNNITLSEKDIDFVLQKHLHCKYAPFIKDTFKDTYYTDNENEWLDIVVKNIGQIENKYKQALVYFALFQACIIKRPFNLFHRKNLYIRTADVKRKFGNKATWDKPFEYYFRKFCLEANAAVFNNNKKNKAYNKDIFDLKETADLVYIDTPYINAKGLGVDYLGFYHFLEGMTDYDNWSKRINWKSKHRSLEEAYCIWLDKNKIKDGFDELFRKFKDSILVVSYRSDGIPSIDELLGLIKKYKKTIYKANHIKYKYVLSHNESKESLLIAE